MLDLIVRGIGAAGIADTENPKSVLCTYVILLRLIVYLIVHDIS